ncbi:MAG: FAD-dependent oxidoreductase [Proteobacteria bacterium]|nr:FAD-dependent oxidoreductase [Pseudomonadota bacterium]MBU2228467.1 FAD-dependent oxidoreductase [Pseudomonadota bacterium]MBU2261400.1 FAD-dependent oxidoreductase [Pseudomonadota bacterium]
MRLLTPISVGKLTLKNRIVMPAMATNFGNVDGSVSDRLIDYYVARADGGLGLIIIEFTAVSFEGRFTQNQLRVDSDRFIPGFAKLVDAVHKAGARIVLQLHHSGRRSPRNVTMTQAIAPSAIPVFPGAPVPCEMTIDEIAYVRDAFIQGAVRAKKAGFDGVEIHATHGYLLAQFLSPMANARTDDYGGTPEKRARLPLEILRGIKEVNGRDFPVIVKMTGDEYTPGGIEIEEALLHAALFEQEGADALCVSGSAGSMMAVSPKAPGIRSTSPPVYIERACYAHLAARVKKHVFIPVMAIGRINDPDVAESLLAEGKADFVAVGRGHIADPAFAAKCSGKRESLCFCIGCLQGCIEKSVQWSNTGITCAVNPKVGREKEATGIRSTASKKVAVIGGGPAGMQAAAILAERGHQVTLFERAERLGGNILVASEPPGKGETLNLIRYLSQRLEKSGAEICLKTVADAHRIRKEKPDAVVICRGASPRRLNVPGVESAKIVTAEEILTGKTAIKKPGRAVVLGGGLVGCETALFLAARGWKVTVVEMMEDIGMDVGPIIKFYLRRKLEESGVEVRVRNYVGEFRDGNAVCRLQDGEDRTYDADLAVLAVGYQADIKLFEEIRALVRDTYIVGDALQPRRILEAMRESFDIAQVI